MSNEEFDLLKERYKDTIQVKNLQKINKSLISDVEIIDTKDIVMDILFGELVIPGKYEKVIFSKENNEIYSFCGKSNSFIKNEDFFLPILERFGKKYGMLNVNCNLKEYGGSKFDLQIIITCPELNSIPLSELSFEKAYSSVRLVNTYNNEFKPYYTIGYSFLQDDFHPIYHTHLESKYYNNVKISNTALKVSDIRSIDTLFDMIVNVLENNDGYSLDSVKKLWAYKIDGVSISNWINKTKLPEHRYFRKKKVTDIVLKTIKLGSESRYNKEVSLGLLHKSLNVCWNNDMVATSAQPKYVEDLDKYFLEPLIKHIDNEQ